MSRRSRTRRWRLAASNAGTGLLFGLLAAPLGLAAALDHWAIGYDASAVVTIAGHLPAGMSCERVREVAVRDRWDPRAPRQELQREADRAGANVVQLDPLSTSTGTAYRCGETTLTRLQLAAD